MLSSLASAWPEPDSELSPGASQAAQANPLASAPAGTPPGAYRTYAFLPNSYFERFSLSPVASDSASRSSATSSIRVAEDEPSVTSSSQPFSLDGNIPGLRYRNPLPWQPIHIPATWRVIPGLSPYLWFPTKGAREPFSEWSLECIAFGAVPSAYIIMFCSEEHCLLQLCLINNAVMTTLPSALAH